MKKLIIKKYIVSSLNIIILLKFLKLFLIRLNFTFQEKYGKNILYL